MELNENQKKAVEYLAGPLLVLAGPGTGKTQLLSQKVAYILTHTDTSPENILCLTFTETGAANMRERLKTIIGKDALKVNIGTYHAFGAEILGMYKNYAENYDRRLDAAVDEVAQFKIVKEIQENLPAGDILRGDNVKDIISVISEAKGAGLTPADLTAIAEQNLADSQVLSEAISPFLLKIVPRVFKASYEAAYRPIFELLKDYAEAPPILKRIERSIAEMARDLAAAMEEAETAQKIRPLSDWKDKYFEKDALGNFRLKDRVANKKLLSVARVMAAYEGFLHENGAYDFDDMIEEAGRVLRSDEGFRLSLEEKFQFIMLDEFQDTNPSQLNLVKLITDYEKPMIMAVGDDDQAIYEFQGALASNLTDYQKYYDAEVVPLTENYRSTQEILDFSREIIRQAPDRFADKSLTAHRPKLEASGIHRIEFNAADAEYSFVAEKIAELIKNDVKQSEIAIIAYKRKYFEPLLPYLKAAEGVKIAYEKRDDLFLDPKMHEILTVARFVDEVAKGKRPNGSLLEILGFSWVKVPILAAVTEMARAREAKKELFAALCESEDVAVKNACEFLARLAADANEEPLEVILQRITARMEIDRLAEYEKFRFYENLSALVGKTRKHFGERRLKLEDLVILADDYMAAGMALTVASPYRDADEAVQVLTAHKAKGLEFEYVFIISADHTAWGKGKGNNNLLALPKNLTQIRHTGTTDSEKLRILYVALTRAKKELYITNALHDFSGKSPERLEYLNEYMDGTEVISPFLPEKSVELRYAAAAPELVSESLKNWLTPYAAATPDMRALYLERAKQFKMSASALTTFVDIVNAGPEAFFKSYILQAPREPATASLALGDLIHATFEQVTTQDLTEAQAAEFFLAELEKMDLEVAVAKEIRETGSAALLTALKAFEPILRSGKAEVDFRSEHLVVDGVPVTGKIDHLAIDEKTKTIEVYDFKTGKFHNKKWDAVPALYKYKLQLLFYKLLLNASPRFAKYQVARAHILFVKPDNDGMVYDKVYDYTAADEAAFKKLLSAVYQQVLALDFLDNPEIFVAADKGYTIKDIQAYIDKICNL